MNGHTAGAITNIVTEVGIPLILALFRLRRDRSGVDPTDAEVEADYEAWKRGTLDVDEQWLAAHPRPTP